MTTAQEVAKWMTDQIDESGELYQEDTVWRINKTFGEEFTYENELGNLAISKVVLREFKKLTSEKVVWERGGRYWRKRNDSDEPTKRQVE